MTTKNTSQHNGFTIHQIIKDAERRFEINDNTFEWSDYKFESQHMQLFVETLIEQKIWSDSQILKIIQACELYYKKRGITQ